MAASRTCSSPTRSSAGQKLRRLMALAPIARIGVCADDAGQVDALEAAAGRGRGHDAGLCRGQYGRQPLRRRTRRTGAQPRPPVADAAASELCRAAGLSRLGPASARLGGAPGGDRAGGRQGRASPATCSKERHPLPGRDRRRHRQLRVRDRQAASTPNCSAAPTSSWTPITAAISTATARRPRPSSRASSSGRR